MRDQVSLPEQTQYDPRGRHRHSGGAARLRYLLRTWARACCWAPRARRLTEGDEANIRVECELDVERGQPRKGGAEGMAGDDDLRVGREAQPRESIMDGIAKLHRAAEALRGTLCAARGKGWGVTCLYWFKNPEWTSPLVPSYGQADGTAFRSAKASLERSASIDVSVPARSHGLRDLPRAMHAYVPHSDSAFGWTQFAAARADPEKNRESPPAGTAHAAHRGRRGRLRR
jgi:hypothetical protein